MDRTSRASLGQPDALPPRVHFLLLQLVQLIFLFRDEAAQGRPFCLVGFDLEPFTKALEIHLGNPLFHGRALRVP